MFLTGAGIGLDLGKKTCWIVLDIGNGMMRNARRPPSDRGYYLLPLGLELNRSDLSKAHGQNPGVNGSQN